MSKMYVILVVVLVKTIVSADDSSDETKYIDLLPEKEKEDFLERIARRIFDGVQSKDDRDAMSGAVSDAELDEQDKFVKDILKQESLNLRKNGNIDINNKTTENIDTGNKNDQNSNVEDETLSNKNIQGYDDESGLVDLTLRDGKRNKRNSFRKAKEDSKIIHVSVGNGEIDSPGEKYFLNEPLMQEQFDEDDIQVKNSKRSLGENTNELEISTPGSRITQMVDFNDEPVKDSDEAIPNGSEETSPTPEINISESTKDNYSHGTTEINSNDDENIGNDNNENNHFGSTQKIFASFEKTEDVNKDSDKMETTSEAIQSIVTSEFTSPDIIAPVEITDKITHENNSLESHNNVSSNARVLRTFSTSVYLEDNKAPKVKDILKDNPEDKAKEIEETQTDLNNSTWTGNDFENITSDLIPTEKTTLLSVTYKEQTTEKNDNVDTTTSNFDVLTKTSLRTSEEATEEKENKKITRDKIVNLKPSIKTLDNADKINSKESMGGELKNIKKGQEEITIENKVNNKNNKETKADEKLNNTTYNLANDMIKALRNKIIPAFNSNEKNFNGVQALYEAIKPYDSEYKVYAVPEGKQPFKKEDLQDSSNKDSPYYVPVYNYSPDNAYYNPHNRLGPNADDDDENVINVDVEADGDDALHANENSHKNRASAPLHDIESSFGSDEFVRESYNKERYNVENLLRELTNYNKTRKYRFIAKNFFKKIKPIKLNLPVAAQHPKFTDIILNSNGYANNNYYYGRSRQKPCIRNHCETDKKKQDDDDLFSNSKEDLNNNVDHEKNLKDHMRAARLLLFRQKYFGNAPEKKSMESVESSLDVLRAKQTRSEDQQAINNIAMDYFFGRMNGDAHATKNKGSKYLKRYYQQYQNKNMQADGYKNRLINGNKKYAYKYDEIPYQSQEITNANRDDQIRIPYKVQSNVNSEIKPATPMYKHEERLPRNFQKRLPKKKENKIQKTKSKTMEFEELKKLLSMTDANDLLPTLDKLKKLNLTTRTDVETYLEPYVTVLGDMMKNNAKALKQYNWLQTTVDIQAALAKIIDMTDELQNNLKISQPDLQLLKYIIYLHKTAKTVQAKDFRKKPVLLPRNRKKKKGIITESGLLNRQWLFRMLGSNHKRIITIDDLDDFNDFINDLQYYLYDFHTAVQQIANITKFNRQKWFENLKEIYLNTEEKRLLEVLLHITTTRLIDLIEESAKNGVEEDYLTFVLKNEKEVERAEEEFGVVLKIIDELKLK